jgi:hypothetical protein
MDCEGYEAKADEYFQAITEGFRREVSRYVGRVLPSVDGSLRDQLKALYAVWLQAGFQEPFVLILDEADKLFPDRREVGSAQTLAEAVRLFRRLRAISQETARMLSLLLCGNRADFNRHNFLGPEVGENPLHMSLQENFVQFLAADEAHAMVFGIGRWKDIRWTEGGLQQSFRWCAGHPFITRLFASYACESGRRKVIDEARVEEAAAEIQRNFRKHVIGDYFRESIWGILHSDEQQCLLRLAGDEDTDEPLADARTRLEQFGLIDEAGRVQGLLFRKWLERQRQ